MAGLFRMGFIWNAPLRRRASFSEIRWSLDAHDPAAPLLTGGLAASDGESILYRLWPAETEPRALIILLHGACDYSSAYDEIGPFLASHGFTSIAYDQRGFGASASRGEWRGKKRMTADVVDAAAFLRSRYGSNLPLFLVGESMGAAVAVHAAARFPTLGLSGIVLAAPGALAGLWRNRILTALLRALRWCFPGGALICERLNADNLTTAAAIRLLADPMVLRLLRPDLMFGLAGLARGATEQARNVRVPSLTMVGTQERIVRIACVKHLHDQLAGPKELAIIEGGPHLLFDWQNSTSVVGRVVEWIETRLMATEPTLPSAQETAKISEPVWS